VGGKRSARGAGRVVIPEAYLPAFGKTGEGGDRDSWNLSAKRKVIAALKKRGGYGSNLRGRGGFWILFDQREEEYVGRESGIAVERDRLLLEPKGRGGKNQITIKEGERGGLACRNSDAEIR